MLHLDIAHRFGEFSIAARIETGPGTTVLFGRSGSGKTTLINAVAGLFMPDQGRITLDGDVLLDTKQGIAVPPHLRRMGYVFQDARLFPHLSVAGNLDYGARYAPAPLPAAARARLIEVLGIGDLLHRRPGHLSGGERQRVALGRALMSAPRLLLMDEPLAALDAGRKAEILPYLELLKAERDIPMLYVTHDMSEITRLADRLAVIRQGRCVAQGLAEDVLADPANVPLIGVHDAGALLTGTLCDHAADGLSAIALSQARLHVPRIAAPLGSQVRLRVRAQDVILSSGPPQGLSSQNALPCIIAALHPGAGPGVAVALHSGTDRLVARITSRAQAQMQLQPGERVWAILKATAVPPTAIGPG